jgi:ribosomal protein L31
MGKKIKLLVLCIMLMSVIPTSAQSIKLYPKIAISYGAESYHIINDVSWVCTDKLPNFNVRAGLEMRYKKLSVYYDNKFWFKVDRIPCTPVQAVFTVGASYKICDKVKLSIEHNCYHPVYTDNMKVIPLLYGGKTEITLSYGY